MLSYLFDIDTTKWNKAPKYRVRRAVVFTALAVAFIYVSYQIGANLYWTSSGYCWGDYFECVGR